MGGSGFVGGRGEGDGHSFTGVQQSAFESRVWKDASGQWKTNTQTDADVLTAAEALCENKTEK